MVNFLPCPPILYLYNWRNKNSQNHQNIVVFYKYTHSLNLSLATYFATGRVLCFVLFVHIYKLETQIKHSPYMVYLTKACNSEQLIKVDPMASVHQVYSEVIERADLVPKADWHSKHYMLLILQKTFCNQGYNLQ